MPNREWKTLSGDKIDNFLDEVKTTINERQDIIHVGCDSQQLGLHTDFVSVIVLLTPGKGGRILWTKERVKRIDMLRTRLLREVELAVNISFTLSKILPESVGLSIHVDVNPNIKFKSSKHFKELVGYVQGCGFDVVTKPDAWAAAKVADFIVKQHHLRST